jgi:Pvc16 N-terminal domain
MSNYLAIATVTATLQRTLQASIQVDVPGARVTTVRPDASGGGIPDVGVNVYLYQASPNPAWRNADLRNRRPKGDLIKQAQAGLDLSYIMTFYGNEVELEPQRLLGSTVRTLVDQPILTAEMIRETINHSSFAFLQASTLADQVERVTIVPSFLSTDDLSKIWSVFFQAPYILSFACQGGAVLIEGDKPSGRGLPIQSRQFYATANQPTIDRILVAEGNNQPIVIDSRLIILGKQLNPEVTVDQLQAEIQRDRQLQDDQQIDLPNRFVRRRGSPMVKLGETQVTPQSITDSEIQLQLTQLSAEEQRMIRAGVQGLQVVYPLVRTLADLEPNSTEFVQRVGSNVAAFVLCPTIQQVGVSGIDRDGDQVAIAEVRVTVDVTIGSGQRVFLLLNQHLVRKPAAYIFAAQPRRADSRAIAFTVRNIDSGDYLVRLQVDGAESPLVIENEQYVSPRVEIR